MLWSQTYSGSCPNTVPGEKWKLEWNSSHITLALSVIVHSTCLQTAWWPEPALPATLSRPERLESHASKTTRSRPQPMTYGRWCINTPNPWHLWWDNSQACFLLTAWVFPVRLSFSHSTVVSGQIMHLLLLAFPFLSYFLTHHGYFLESSAK